MPRKTLTIGRTDGAGECFNEAAARCRGKHRQAGTGTQPKRASMRPRPDAAENITLPAGKREVAHGFNEAAARCRGKPCQPMPAGRRRNRFNEAAARCRGKLL